jgi:deazaflavin-dependent oxidoreductase (nitroreductase family)
MSNFRNRIGNPFMSFILRSPLHGLLSKNMLLITVTGRKSGRRFTTPVGYVRDGADLLIVSALDRTWWKNLRGGAPVIVRLQGRDVPGRGTAIEDRSGVAGNLIRLLRAAPQYQKYLKMPLTPGGQPVDPAALAQAAAARVIVRITSTS